MTRRSRLKVVLVIGTADPGGAEGQLVRLALGLQDRGHAVSVYFLVGGGPLTDALDRGGVPWWVIGALRPETSRIGKLAQLRKFAAQLRRDRPDIVYAWLPGVIWLTLPVAAIVTRAKRVAAFRGLVQEFEIRSAARRLAFRWSVKWAHAVTANAPWLKDEACVWGARESTVFFVPNGVLMSATAADARRQPPTAVVVANFFEYKAHHLVVHALTKVCDLHVTFIGSGDTLQRTKDLASELGVRHRTRFIEDCHSVYRFLPDFQFAIHPSRTEGMSNAILEELAHGLPVVATDVGATNLLIDDGVNGYLVPADDLARLTDRVAQMTASPGLRERLGAKARVTAHGFSWEASLDRHEQLFLSLSGLRNQRAR